MDIIIVIHTEFGSVRNLEVLSEKRVTEGVRKGVPNLVRLADKYCAKLTFTVIPEVVTHVHFSRAVNLAGVLIQTLIIPGNHMPIR
jgi:hypothetical protein